MPPYALVCKWLPDPTVRIAPPSQHRDLTTIMGYGGSLRPCIGLFARTILPSRHIYPPYVKCRMVYTRLYWLETMHIAPTTTDGSGR